MLNPKGRTLAGVLLVAILARAVGLLAVSGWPPIGDEASYLAAAGALVQRGQQDVFWPPLTSWWLAMLWPLTGGDPFWSRCCSAALDVLNTGLVWATCQRLVGQDPVARRQAPLWAALAYALYLPAIGFACNATSEVPSLTLLLLSLWLLCRPVPSWRAACAAGLCLGLLTLARSNLALMGLAMALAMLVQTNRPQRGRQAAALLSLSLLVPGAWVWRNHAAHEGWVLSHNGSYNLYMGNAPKALDSLDLFSPRASTAQQAVRAGRVNEDARTALRLSPAERQAMAWQWIASDPLTFARRALGRLARVWAPKTAQLSLAGGEGRLGLRHPVTLTLLAVGTAQWAALLWFGVRGLAAWHARRPETGALLLAAVLGALPLCLVAIAKPRYAFPFEPVLMMAAAAWGQARWTSPGASRHRLVAWLCLAFIAWAWAAWAVFAFTSR